MYKVKICPRLHLQLPILTAVVNWMLFLFLYNIKKEIFFAYTRIYSFYIQMVDNTPIYITLIFFLLIKILKIVPLQYTDICLIPFNA